MGDDGLPWLALGTVLARGPLLCCYYCYVLRGCRLPAMASLEILTHLERVRKECAANGRSGLSAEGGPATAIS